MKFQKIREIFTLDLRSLALFRIALGLLIIGDLFTRSVDLTAHYTDAGVLPASTLFDIYGSRVYASIHVIASGSLTAEALVFALHAIAAIALLVGYRTRLATVLCWYLSVSLQFRMVPLPPGAPACPGWSWSPPE